MNRNSNFWISYADLMTSLFFIMLVLFIVLVGRLVSIGGGVDVATLLEKIDMLTMENSELKKNIESLNKEIENLNENNNRLKGKLEATEEQLAKLEELYNVQELIDPKYFKYDNKFNRFTLKDITAKFNTKSFDINDIPKSQREKLLDVGISLAETFTKAKNNEKTKDAQYLLIVEGQASKDTYDQNYELSYYRALSLVKYWNRNRIKFPSNCEIIISGSGVASKFRDKPDTPPNNQRFVIHIIPKPGKIPSVKNN